MSSVRTHGGSQTGGLGGSTFSGIEQQIAELSNLTPEERHGLTQELQHVKEAIYKSDVWFYRIVVLTLGLEIVLIIIAISILLWHKVQGFDALTAIGSAAIGGLVGLIAPSPVKSR